MSKRGDFDEMLSIYIVGGVVAICLIFWAITSLPDKVANSETPFASRVSAERNADYIPQASAKPEPVKSLVAPTPTLEAESSATFATDLPSVVREWSPRIVRITCQEGGYTFSGSGVLTRMDFPEFGENAPTLVTNKHVLVNSITGNQLSNCNFQVSDTDQILALNSANYYSLPAEDVAFIPSRKTKLPAGAATAMRICKAADASIGDSVAVLGYPVDGGTGQASTAITVTRGVISSYDGEYYVTDAKVDHGNSGGAAILLKKSCYLGIPTWVQNGSLESFGRILSAQYFLSI